MIEQHFDYFNMQKTIGSNDLKILAEKVRKRVVEIIYHAKGGHIGGSLSSVDMVTTLYFSQMNIQASDFTNPNRDRFILSKGHSVETLYAVLEEKGFIDKTLTDTYGDFNSKLAGHPTRKIPGVELNSGALGHGLSVGVGLAKSAKILKNSFKTYVLMGDGEQGEGSIYEAAMSASHYELDNLIAVIDRNKLQISGNTEYVMSLEPMRERWESFGWEVLEVDGNNVEEIQELYAGMNFNNQKPKLIISHTVKGKGISYMEHGAKWHHGVPSEEQYQNAIQEIESRIKELSINE